MNDRQPNVLLDAVDALTKPIKRKVIQDIVDGTKFAGTKTVTLEFPSLLDQLDDAIRGTIGIGGSGSLASERNMLDADALYKLVLITSLVKDWARSVKAQITPADAGRTLRAWYARYVETPRSVESERFYVRKMEAWATQIEQKLDPPRIRELPDACPICEASVWFNPQDRLPYLHPLVIEFRETGPDLIQQAKALCRACAQVWGVRELAWELEQAEALRHAGESAVPTD